MLPLVLAASLLAPVVAAAAAPRRVITRGDGIIRSPIRAIPDPASKLRVRQNEVEVENQRAGTRYAVEVQVGTPPQTLTLILDTGSPDTWINPSCDTANVPSDCRSFGQFDSAESSSFEATKDRDVLVYGIGNATVQYVYETLTIGSATIEKQQIGIALESHMIPLGILGMSPPLRGVNDYPYVLDTMVDQGLIQSRAFSVDLRGVDNPNGALIFGGIDTGKYIGDLAKLPMLDREDTPLGADRYYVTMTGVGLTLPDGTVTQSEEIAVPVFLDTGSTFTRLPTPIYQAFAASFASAQYDPESGYYFVDCEVTELEGASIDFYFGSKTIRVALNDFIWQVQGYCILGVLPDDEEPILGDTFLRAAYVVFDQDNRNIHIAQAANCGTNLVAIGSGEDAVPSSTGDCTELPTPTAAADSLDVTATRAPTNTFTGTARPTINQGPGPAASKGTGGGTAPQPTTTTTGRSGSQNAAGRGVELGFGAIVTFGVVNLLTLFL
ncbi:acid protease [Parathielavia appendiculata]|uniref:Acid protease n=1 Tax=Parathielavia appendiculata TaxID=2587402 RepID=A0AAN6YZ53_9PEZI|nr:acid protease [Parathielavia appendiculata]